MDVGMAVPRNYVVVWTTVEKLHQKCYIHVRTVYSG